ncbi:hypothetical protein ACW2QC_03780 [Virgibacillus sp. FSP13]
MRAEKTDTSQTLAEIFEEMRQEGEEVGIEKGMEKGMEQGRKNALSQVVLELIKEGFTNEHIAKITKLELDEVAELRKTFLT